MAEAKQVELEDSNIAGIGSEADVAARKAAAATDPAWAGAGQAVGVEVWRVENRRTEDDNPDFGVAKWPQEEYGSFYSGDSYIVLKTIKDPESGKLQHDVHFWLGESTTQDEMGVAAYKTVELDDLLDGEPVQHREIQGSESPLFMSYFPHVKYMEGGIESGFRHVAPEEFEPRLFHVQKVPGCKKSMRVCQVALSIDSLNQGDSFVLDAGRKVYLYRGDYSSPFEKAKANNLMNNMVNERDGKASTGDSEDPEFWALVGGSAEEVSNDESPPRELDEFGERVVLRLSDETGALTFNEVARGSVSRAILDSSDVFVIDVQSEVFVWVGSGASPAERRNSMKSAMQYLTDHNRPAKTHITRVVEGAREPTNFEDVFNA